MKTRLADSSFTPQKLFHFSEREIRPAPHTSEWGQMHESDAVGIDVIRDKTGSRPFGMGWIKFPPNGEVRLHTHEGSHILVCFAGHGSVVVMAKQDIGVPEMKRHSIGIGECYNIESLVPHSVHAGSDGLLLLVIGNDYREAVSHERLQLVNGW